MILGLRLLEVFDLDPLTGAFREPLLDIYGKPFEFKSRYTPAASPAGNAPAPQQEQVPTCNGKES